VSASFSGDATPSLGRSPPGRVWFVGAGPGSPDLLTLRALDCLERADVIVHDALVPPSLLTRPGAVERCIAAPRGDGHGADSGTATGDLLARLATSGRRVVRLKGGDPGVFARLTEEIAPLDAAGIHWEIVPGVTAALAAAAAAGAALTSRQGSSSLTLVTGHGAAGTEDRVDFGALARVPGTLAVYMGVEQVRAWAGALVAAGRDPDTPVTLVSHCGWPDQRIVRSNLAACASAAATADCPPPTVALVGLAPGASAPRCSGPLTGRTVLVTRPRGQTDDLVRALEAAGATPHLLPLVTIGPPPDGAALDRAIDAADRYDWIVFASANGVDAFAGRLRALSRDGRALGTARLAAIGGATARALATAGLVCDAVPELERSEGLVDLLADAAHRGRFLLVRADAGRDVLATGLRAAGHHVDEVAAYTSRPLESLPPGARAALDATAIDWITVTSGRIAEAACRLFGDGIRRWRVASISPVTSAALRRLGVEPDAEALRPTAAALVGAIAAADGRAE